MDFSHRFPGDKFFYWLLFIFFVLCYFLTKVSVHSRVCRTLKVSYAFFTYDYKFFCRTKCISAKAHKFWQNEQRPERRSRKRKWRSGACWWGLWKTQNFFLKILENKFYAKISGIWPHSPGICADPEGEQHQRGQLGVLKFKKKF